MAQILSLYFVIIATLSFVHSLPLKENDNSNLPTSKQDILNANASESSSVLPEATYVERTEIEVIIPAKLNNTNATSNISKEENRTKREDSTVHPVPSSTTVISTVTEKQLLKNEKTTIQKKTSSEESSSSDESNSSEENKNQENNKNKPLTLKEKIETLQKRLVRDVQHSSPSAAIVKDCTSTKPVQYNTNESSSVPSAVVINDKKSDTAHPVLFVTPPASVLSSTSKKED